MRHKSVWRRLRQLGSVIVLPFLIVLTLVGAATRIAEGNREAEQQRQQLLEVQCTSARSDALTLKALRSLERAIGIPVTFEIPEVPEECDGS